MAKRVMTLVVLLDLIAFKPLVYCHLSPPEAESPATPPPPTPEFPPPPPPGPGVRELCEANCDDRCMRFNYFRHICMGLCLIKCAHIPPDSLYSCTLDCAHSSSKDSHVNKGDDQVMSCYQKCKRDLWKLPKP